MSTAALRALGVSLAALVALTACTSPPFAATDPTETATQQSAQAAAAAPATTEAIDARDAQAPVETPSTAPQPAVAAEPRILRSGKICGPEDRIAIDNRTTIPASKLRLRFHLLHGLRGTDHDGVELVRDVVPDEDGAGYVVLAEGLPGGEYEITVDTPLGRAAVHPGRRVISVETHCALTVYSTDIELPLTGPTVPIKGRVLDVDGAPVSRLEFIANVLFDSDRAHLERSVVTGENGDFIVWVPREFVAVAFGLRHRAEQDFSISGMMHTSMRESAVELLYLPLLSTTGAVVDHASDPLAGRKLHIEQFRHRGQSLGSHSTDVTTDDAGRFDVRLEPGAWRVRLYREGGGYIDLGTIDAGSENVRLTLPR